MIVVVDSYQDFFANDYRSNRIMNNHYAMIKMLIINMFVLIMNNVIHLNNKLIGE